MIKGMEHFPCAKKLWELWIVQLGRDVSQGKKSSLLAPMGMLLDNCRLLTVVTWS